MAARTVSSILLCALGLTTTLFAQQPSSSRIEVAAGVQLPGGLMPIYEPVNFPRQPPIVKTHDLRVIEPAVGGRVQLGDRIHFRAAYAWAPETTVYQTFDRPIQAPPFTGYTSEVITRERHRTLALVPAVDLTLSRHVRPWIGGGVAWRWWHEDRAHTFIDFQTGASSTIQTDGADTERMTLVEGGVRVPFAQRLVIGASARGNFWRTTPASRPAVPPRSPRVMLDVSAGVVF